jgi:hypothetical protein
MAPQQILTRQTGAYANAKTGGQVVIVQCLRRVTLWSTAATMEPPLTTTRLMDAIVSVLVTTLATIVPFHQFHAKQTQTAMATVQPTTQIPRTAVFVTVMVVTLAETAASLLHAKH